MRPMERGAGKLTLIVFGLLVAGVVFVAYNVLPFYYYYYELQSQMEQVVKVASTNADWEVRRKIMYFVNKMKLPAEAEDLIVNREDGMIEVRLKYREVFYISWQGKDHDLWVFDFDAHAEGPVG